MSKERVIVYIDGSNLFYYCKELSIPSYPHFDFEQFVDFLVGDRVLISKNYYIGGVRAKLGERLYKLKTEASRLSTLVFPISQV